MFTAAYIPFESSINLNLAYGDAVHRSFRSGDNFLDIFTQLEPGQLGAYHVQDRPYFAYNPTYSSQPGSIKYISASIYAENNVVTSNRIACSEAKTNNEILDNWTKFKFANYLDVDNKYGQITNLTSFKDRLFFWQDTALGIASVNERSLIQDNNVGQLTLGTGGILTRADYLTNTNGSSIVMIEVQYTLITYYIGTTLIRMKYVLTLDKYHRSLKRKVYRLILMKCM